MTTQVRTENGLERFVRKTRELFASEPDLEKRWTALEPILAELLADPEIIEASRNWPDCEPADGRAENLLFYEDLEFKFAINGLVSNAARAGGSPRIHDHAHIYTLYGLMDGHQTIERFERLDDRSRPDYAEIRETRSTICGPGEIDLVQPYEIHREIGIGEAPWRSSFAARRAAASIRAATCPAPTSTTRASARGRPLARCFRPGSKRNGGTRTGVRKAPHSLSLGYRVTLLEERRVKNR